MRGVLAQLEAATLELITSDGGGGALHLSSLPTFAAKWLIPRLPLAEQALRGGYHSGMGYWCCYPEGRTQLHALQCFREWLLLCAEAGGPPLGPTSPGTVALSSSAL